MNSLNRNILKILAAGATVASIVSCSGGGGSSVSVIGSIIGGGGSSSLTITNVYPSAELTSFSTPQASNRYYVRGLSASIYGNCARGIATIKVNEGGPDYAQTATCLADGTFIWSKTYIATAEEGDKTLTLTGYDLAGIAISGATTTVDVRVDATVPTAPGYVTPASSPYDFTGSATTFTIQLSAPGDAVKMTGPSGVELTLSGGNYEYTVPLTSGASNTYTFYSHDLAGNASVGTDVTISYLPAADLKIGGTMFIGGPVADTSGATFSMESSVSPLPGEQTDSGTSYLLKTGFNFITNQVRAD